MDRQSQLRNVLKPDRFPDAIIHVASEEDVREAVRFAVKEKLKVAVRGGGHSWCGSPLRQGGLLLALPSRRSTDAPPMPDMAFSMPGSVFAGVYGIWQDPAQDATNQQWVRQTSKLLDPITVGHYIGETDLTADTNRARQSFAPANWQRLQQLKKKYDPDDVFFSYLGPA